MIEKLVIYVNGEDIPEYKSIQKEYKSKGYQSNILFGDMLKAFVVKREKEAKK